MLKSTSFIFRKFLLEYIDIIPIWVYILIIKEIKQMTIYIKKWFQNKIECRRGFFFGADLNGEFTVEKETEKAYMIMVEIESNDGEYDDVQSVWIPKSCVASAEERQAEIEAAEKRFSDGCERYEKLVAFCKENGVKGARTGLKTRTLLALVEKAGLTYTC